MTEVAVCSDGDSAGFNIKMNKILTSTWVAAFNISWIILTIMWWAVKGLGEVSFCQCVITRFSCVPFSSFPLLNSRQSCQHFYCICWGYPTCLYTLAFCVIQYVLQMCLIFVECPLLFQPPPSFMSNCQSPRIHYPSYCPRTIWRLPEIVSLRCRHWLLLINLLLTVASNSRCCSFSISKSDD